MKKNLLSVLAATVLSLPLIGHTQLPSLGSLIGGGSSNSAGDLSTQQDAILSKYIAADKLVISGQAKMSEALGMKDEAAKLRATADSLGSGATKDSLGESDTLVSENSKRIQEQLRANPKLTEEAKKIYTSGMIDVAQGGLNYVSMSSDIQAFASSLASNPMAAVGKLSTGAYIVKTLPSNLKNLKETLSVAANFAKENKIPVPSNATSLL